MFSASLDDRQRDIDLPFAMNFAASPAQLFPFDNSYARLPDRFYARHLPTAVASPRLIRLNVALARELGLDPEKLATAEGVEMLAGNRVAENSAPLAMAYAGHQFGSFVPRLGDGRAILLGEIVGRDGRRRCSASSLSCAATRAAHALASLALP